MATRLLTALEIDEVSGVDEPANEDARVVLLKAANAIPGVSAIRKALAESGEAAAEAFDGALADNGEVIAALVAKGEDEALPVMAHALAESIATIVDGAPAAEQPELLAQTAEQFSAAVAEAAEAAGVEVTKAKPPMKPEGKGKGDGFKPCGDCPDRAACGKAGRCAAEKPAPVGKAASDTMDAFGKMGERIAKAAATFNELNAGREQREALNRMTWALQDSISSIMSDPAATDKAAMIRKSVAEFDAAVAEIAGEIEEELAEAAGGDGEGVAKSRADGTADGGNDAGSAGNPQEHGSMAQQGEREDVVKSLREKVEKMETAERKREAVSKARTLLPAGGPVDQLGELLAGASEAQVPLIEGVVKALGAQVDASRIFGAAGASIAQSGDMAASSPVVKAAQAHAERVAKARGGAR